MTQKISLRIATDKGQVFITDEARILAKNGWTVRGGGGRFNRKMFGRLVMQPPDAHCGDCFIATVIVPDMDEVISCATEKHIAGEYWTGLAWDWPASYRPPSPLFPASFYIGYHGWSIRLLWENGNDAATVTINNRNVVSEQGITP